MQKYVPDTEFGFGSLEGYLNARVLVQALRDAGPTVTRAALMQALDGMSKVNMGGIDISFSANDHQGSDTVYLTTLQQGRYKQLQSLKDR